MKERKYSLRKYSVGLVSAVVGLGIAATPAVHAAETGGVETLKPVEGKELEDLEKLLGKDTLTPPAGPKAELNKEDAAALLKKLEKESIDLGGDKTTEKETKIDKVSELSVDEKNALESELAANNPELSTKLPKDNEKNIKDFGVSAKEVKAGELTTATELEALVKDALTLGKDVTVKSVTNLPASASGDFKAVVTVEKGGKEATLFVPVTVVAKEVLAQQPSEKYVYAYASGDAKDDEAEGKRVEKELKEVAEAYVNRILTALGADSSEYKLESKISTTDAVTGEENLLESLVKVAVTHKDGAKEEYDVPVFILGYEKPFSDNPVVITEGEDITVDALLDSIVGPESAKLLSEDVIKASEIKEGTNADGAKYNYVEVKVVDKAGKTHVVEVGVKVLPKLEVLGEVLYDIDYETDEVDAAAGVDVKARRLAEIKAGVEEKVAEAIEAQLAAQAAQLGVDVDALNYTAEVVGISDPDAEGKVLAKVRYTVTYTNPATGEEETTTIERDVTVQTRELINRGTNEGDEAVTEPWVEPALPEFTGTLPALPGVYEPGRPAPMNKEEVKKEGKTLPNTTAATTTAALGLGLALLALTLRKRVK